MLLTSSLFKAALTQQSVTVLLTSESNVCCWGQILMEEEYRSIYQQNQETNLSDSNEEP